MSTTIIGTSNNRVTCTVNLISEAAGLEITDGWVYDNGTTLVVEGLGDTSRISMIHPTTVSNPDRFVCREKFNEKFKNDLPIPLEVGKKKIVVRHGFAGHNDPNATLQQSHDASLTELGLTQASNSGKAIVEYTKGVLPNLTVKSSDLVRTMETIERILQEIPEDQRTDTCEVCIEARENSRPFKGTHHWKRDDPLTEKAIDPTISLENARLLAPGKTDPEVEKMCIENRPRNDPIKDWDACTKKINGLNIDWTVYKQKLTNGYAAGKTFGQIACEKTLFDIIFEK
jgi:hypothetical protein